jgi:predicted O-methyltransferase YrrM
MDRQAALRQVRHVIERLVSDGSAVARSDGSAHSLFPVAIPPAEGAALRDRVVRESASRTIEVGLGYGLSALYICEALVMNDAAGTRHVAIDPYQAGRFANCGLQFLEEAGVIDLIEYHAEESQTVLPQFLRDGRGFDLAFIDGNHRFDAVFVDLVYLGRLVRPGGLLVMDDYQLPAVARAASFFAKNLAWTLEEVSPTDDLHQWAILRTSALPDTRPFDYFIDF